MCGIAGIIHSDRSDGVSPDVIRTMCDSLTHRGPDHFGHYVRGPVGLGMRRLSIIDLRTGDQPIPNEDETIWIVFNGEIYNYQHLRKELEAKGHCFRTSSDTEVIVHLYEEFGANCVQHLRGMFAFAIWDSRQHVLLLARDRLGIKPLYYAEMPEGLVFGSELKALLLHPGIRRDVNPDALAEYFVHFCVPGDLSIFKAFKKLPAGYTLTYQHGQSNLTRYWHIQPTPDDSQTEREWIEQLRYHLKDAVESHMVADVPVGAFLSGGLDSGTLIALMAQASTPPIRTFTVGFTTDAGRFDERIAARTVAHRYGTTHHECLLKADVSSILPRLIAAFDEPFADSGAIPNWLVCQETARHVKVALSGLGGDELFGGYERYLGLQLGERYYRIPRMLRLALSTFVQNLPSRNGLSYQADRVKRFVAAGDMPLTDRYRHFISAFGDAQEILHPDVKPLLSHRMTRYEQVTSELTIGHPVDLGLFTDLYLYLPDDLLFLSDRVSMAHSLEVRVPFLDHLLVEFVARIPAHFKVRGLQKKFIFRRTIVDWLPKEHFKMPKQGFSVPMAAWLRGSLRPMLCDLVASQEWRTSGWLNYAAVQQLVDEHLAGRANHESRLWAIVCFKEWERQYRSVSQADMHN
ncbi:MAG TPA: asparagine synthase (glutamine-hydrolyzing) [Nitrospira sp.]|nr:asparagine synthase (glutamine-hydrolyzing) [Nitrospira sp.]